MEFQQEIEALYKQAQGLRAEGHSAESEILESKAAGILQELKNRVDQAPNDPSRPTPTSHGRLSRRTPIHRGSGHFIFYLFTAPKGLRSSIGAGTLRLFATKRRRCFQKPIQASSVITRDGCGNSLINESNPGMNP